MEISQEHHLGSEVCLNGDVRGRNAEHEKLQIFNVEQCKRMSILQTPLEECFEKSKTNLGVDTIRRTRLTDPILRPE